MLMTVKVNLHDWPKRGAFARNEVEVEAGDDTEAVELGLMMAQQKWPGAKVRAYDVVKPRPTLAHNHTIDSHAVSIITEVRNETEHEILPDFLGSTAITTVVDPNGPYVMERDGSLTPKPIKRGPGRPRKVA